LQLGVGLPVAHRVGTAASEETLHELAFPVEQALTPGALLEHAPSSVKGVPFQDSPPSGVTFAPVPSWVQSLTPAKRRADLPGLLLARRRAQRTL